MKTLQQKITAQCKSQKMREALENIYGFIITKILQAIF